MIIIPPGRSSTKSGTRRSRLLAQLHTTERICHTFHPACESSARGSRTPTDRMIESIFVCGFQLSPVKVIGSRRNSESSAARACCSRACIFSYVKFLLTQKGRRLHSTPPSSGRKWLWLGPTFILHYNFFPPFRVCGLVWIKHQTS
jgi:hypothetical protein